MRVLIRSAWVAVLVAVALVLTGTVVAPTWALTTGSTGGTTGSSSSSGSSADPAGEESPTAAAVPGGTSTGDAAATSGTAGASPRSLAAATTTATTTTTVPTTPTTPTTPPPPPLGSQDPDDWQMTSAGTQTAGGASFNNQYGSVTSQRRNLTRVISAINGTPGWKLPIRDNKGVAVLDPKTLKPLTSCPADQARWPSRIRISVYSVADGSFANALVRAHRRCVSVQILMNNHLTESTSRSWGTIARNLNAGGKVKRTGRSFAYRCSFGCRGTGVLHSKFYLFDSRGGRPDHTVMVGSSNMTTNAVRVQANDLYGVNGSTGLFDALSRTFTDMAFQRRASSPRTFSAGKYSGYFYPYRRATASTDLTARALRSVRCTGATGGAGINGRSVVYINIHAWHGTRGRWLAQRVKSLYNQGCYVRILYSFMGKGTYTYLKKGTGSRMIVRRVLFSNARQVVAVKYSHQKMFAVSGNVAGDSAAWVVWTGSNNFTDRGLKADEITLRIADRAAFNQYSANWWFQRNQRSSDTWAIYEEPNGGGRAPD